MNNRSKYTLYGWLFILPAVILFFIFAVYPAIESFKLSFQTFRAGQYTFVGLSNYKRLLNDTVFLQSIKNTFFFLIFQVPIMLILALIFSTLLNSRKVKAKPFFRTALFIPSVTSLVAYSVLFKMMFSYNGLVNRLLMFLNILSDPIQWLNHPIWAKIVIIVALLWRWTGYNMIFYLASLQNIPPETYEAAEMDGANPFQIFYRVTIPQLKPVILLTTIMSTNGTLQLFDEVMNITNGGPANETLTMSQYIYNQSFVFSANFGYAATLSYVIVGMMIILAIIQFKVAGDN